MEPQVQVLIGYVTKTQIEILSALDEHSGLLTRSVAQHVSLFSDNARMRSGAVRSWLNIMKKRGWVEFLDDQKPVCWKRTAVGTAAFNEVTQKWGERQ